MRNLLTFLMLLFSASVFVHFSGHPDDSGSARTEAKLEQITSMALPSVPTQDALTTPKYGDYVYGIPF